MLLGVSPDAGENEVLRAYRLRAPQWHPDRNPDPRAAEMFNRITRAREVLLEELRSPRTEPTIPTPPPEPEPESPWGSTHTTGESAYAPGAEPQAPPDPWDQGPPHATRPAQPGGYRDPFSGSAPKPSYRVYSAPPPRGQGSAIAALVTAILMVLSCFFVFAVPSVILAIMALSRSHDHEKAVRYERYAWISIVITLVGGVAIGLAVMNGGE
ncbi:DnaJ domain-containing protein [Nocardiopsis sp. NPDC060348]